jgi:hypothetical protein
MASNRFTLKPRSPTHSSVDRESGSGELIVRVAWPTHHIDARLSRAPIDI